MDLNEYFNGIFKIQFINNEVSEMELCGASFAPNGKPVYLHASNGSVINWSNVNFITPTN